MMVVKLRAGPTTPATDVFVAHERLKFRIRMVQCEATIARLKAERAVLYVDMMTLFPDSFHLVAS